MGYAVKLQKGGGNAKFYNVELGTLSNVTQYDTGVDIEDNYAIIIFYSYTSRFTSQGYFAYRDTRLGIYINRYFAIYISGTNNRISVMPHAGDSSYPSSRVEITLWKKSL